MNDLKAYFENNSGRQINKWEHYFEIYDRHFRRFRNQEVCILEFGVAHGGSLQMWKHYFGQNAKVVGVDIREKCKQLEEEQIEIWIGSQEDRNFLQNLKSKLPKIDILIDDGGHTMQQQLCTFEELFPHLSENGIYVCEDMHSSYVSKYGGGYKDPNSFMEYSKNLIDLLNAWHSEDKEKFQVSEFTRSVYSMHYYHAALVIEKQQIKNHGMKRTGNPSW